MQATGHTNLSPLRFIITSVASNQLPLRDTVWSIGTRMDRSTGVLEKDFCP
jgi:hypothetical protein